MVLSVVVPMYNAAAHVERCLAQLRNQGLFASDYEVIFVDDASTDDSAAIVQRFCRALPNVRLVKQPQQRGAGAARNAGLDAAEGEYLYYFDADDALEEGALAKLVARAQRDALDVLFFAACVAYDTPELEHTAYQDPAYFARTYEGGITMGRDLFIYQVQNNDFCAQPCMQITRTAMLRAQGVRFPEGIVNEDNVFVMDSTLAAARADVSLQQYYTYKVHAGSVTTSAAQGRARYDAHVYILSHVLRLLYAAKAAGDVELANALAGFCNWLSMCAEQGLLVLAPEEVRPPQVAGAPGGPDTFALHEAFFQHIYNEHHEWKRTERELAEAQQRIATLEAQLEEVYASHSWKAGRAVTALPRAVKSLASGRGATEELPNKIDADAPPAPNANKANETI